MLLLPPILKEASPGDAAFLTCKSVVLSVILIPTLPSDETRTLSLPAVSNEIVLAAGNLIVVSVSPL